MIRKINRSWKLFLLLTVLIMLMGGWLMVKITHWGPWAFSDSASYVSAARNFAHGMGFVIVNSNGSLTRVTEFPPFYPIFLSFFVGNNADPNIVLRWVNVGLFIAFLAIFESLLFITTHNNVLSLLGTLLCAASPVLLEVFSGVMSETLFLPLLCLIFLLTTVYFKNENTSVFILLCVFACLLPITRYAGALFIAGIALLMLFRHGKEARYRRLRDTLIFLVISLSPVAIWLYRLYVSFSKVGGKKINLGISIIEKLLQSFVAEFNVIKTWLPYYGVYKAAWFDQTIQLGSLALMLVLVCLLCRKYSKKSADPSSSGEKILFGIALINLCAYLLFIAFTHSVTIPQIDIIDRMLAPILPLIVMIFILGFTTFPMKKYSIPLITLVLISVIVLRFDFLRSWTYANEMEANGQGYSARQYQESGIIAEIKAIPDDQRMVSNTAGFVLYYTNRFPIQIDQFANRTFGTHNGYGEKWVREKGASLIILYPEFRNFYGGTAAQLLSTVTNGLDVHYQDTVGGIYYYPKSGITRR